MQITYFVFWHSTRGMRIGVLSGHIVVIAAARMNLRVLSPAKAGRNSARRRAYWHNSPPRRIPHLFHAETQVPWLKDEQVFCHGVFVDKTCSVYVK